MALLGEWKQVNQFLVEYKFGEDALLKDGQDLEEGSVLTLDNGKVRLISDDSDEPYAILLKRAKADGADISVPVLKAGKVNENFLIFGGSHTADSTREKMRDLGIYYVKGEA